MCIGDVFEPILSMIDDLYMYEVYKIHYHGWYGEDKFAYDEMYVRQIIFLNGKRVYQYNYNYVAGKPSNIPSEIGCSIKEILSQEMDNYPDIDNYRRIVKQYMDGCRDSDLSTNKDE